MPPSVARTNEHKTFIQALAIQHGFEIPILQSLLSGLVALGLPIAAIPQHDRTAATLPFRDRALEIAVVEQVVLDFDGELLVMWIARWSLGYGPEFENATELEAQS